VENVPRVSVSPIAAQQTTATEEPSEDDEVKKIFKRAVQIIKLEISKFFEILLFVGRKRDNKKIKL
jgi:hypothetical protein